STNNAYTVQQLERKITELEATIRRKDQELHHFTTSAKTHSGYVEQLERDLRTANAQASTAKESLTDLKSAVKEKNVRVEQLAAEKKALENTAKEHEQTIKNLRSAVRNLNDTMNVQQNENTRVISDLKAQLTALQQQVSQHEKKGCFFSK